MIRNGDTSLFDIKKIVSKKLTKAKYIFTVKKKIIVGWKKHKFKVHGAFMIQKNPIIHYHRL